LNWKELKSKSLKIAGAVSGGLDSCTVTHWLSEKGFEIHTYTVDLGQPDEENLDVVISRMLSCGAKSANIIDGKKELADAGLKIIQSQAKYEGEYWNTTGIARPVTTKLILDSMNDKGIETLFHGATGRGNDQIRFQLGSNMLYPNFEVYAPWRDPEFLSEFPGRNEMLDYCISNSLPIKPKSESKYSTDANFLGLTHEAGDLEDVTLSPFFVNTGMGVWPWESEDKHEIVSIQWEKGVPISINDEKLDLVNIFDTANNIGGKHGIGIGTHVIENRFVGIKSRGIYESPGMEILGKSYEYLLQFILDRRSRELFENLSNVISRQVYQGYWFDLATNTALDMLNKINYFATGTIYIRVYKGNIYFEYIDKAESSIPYSLYTDDSSMEGVGNYDHVDAEGFVKVLGVSAKNFGLKQGPFINK
tara:strand:- start:537 stop:1796 length:1260 start_codon:yes stop_codon:yes gene_type:complete